MPLVNSIELVHSHNPLSNISLKQCFLLVDYAFLDEEERLRFSQAKHEYLIQQTIILNEKTIENTNRNLQIELSQPVKMIAWVCQQSIFKDKRNNDNFNYTNSHIRKNDKLIGKNLVTNATILFNGHERVSLRNSSYFQNVQSYQHFPYSTIEGINIYSFCLFPESHQPSGSANMSKIDNVEIKLAMDPIVNFKNTCKFRGYAVNYNILRIANGLCGVVFSN